METNRHSTDSGRGSFATTQWSLALAASTNPVARIRALEKLCRTYWPPIHNYLRRRGQKPHDAQDLTRSCFAALLSRNALENLHPGQGKFRSFSLASVNNFLANDYDRNHAAKRGGGQVIVSLDDAATEEDGLLKLASTDTPEKTLDRRWALWLRMLPLNSSTRELMWYGQVFMPQFFKHKQVNENTATRAADEVPAAFVKETI